MKRKQLVLAGLTFFFCCAFYPRFALPCGPGVHVREAKRVLERMMTNDPIWASFLRHPLAPSYIRLGSISPDFQWAIRSLGFGHSLELSYFLLSKAMQEQSAEHALFSLGHLAHISSDASCETFLTPTVIGSVPLGMTDFIEGYDDALGESEGIIESYGDLLLGDYDGVVDLVYDFWFEGDMAKQRGREIFLWYCQTGVEFYDNQVDCDQALFEFETLLGKGEDFLGNLDRQGAKDLVHSLLSLPIESLLDLAMGGALSALIGDMAKPTPWAKEEAQRVLQTALGDPIFWKDLYENHFQDLAPTWTLERVETQVLGDWPDRSNNAIICGNIQSVMQFLPDFYNVQPGLIVDGVWWEMEDGTKLNAVSVEDEGKRIVARVRLFSALSYSGKVKVVVKSDKYGLDNSLDEVLGEESVDVRIDPFAYVHTERLEVMCPFTVKTSGAKGFYVEVFDGNDKKPLFTSNWDRLWQIEGLNFFSPIYKDNFGSYGHWPLSLPISDCLEAYSTLFVRVTSAKENKPLEGAWASIEGEAFSRTNKNGVAILDMVLPGTKTLEVGARNYLVRKIEVGVQRNEERFLEVALEDAPFRTWGKKNDVREVAPGLAVMEMPELHDTYEKNQEPEDAIADDSKATETTNDEHGVIEDSSGEDAAETVATTGGGGGCATQTGECGFSFVIMTMAFLCAMWRIKRMTRHRNNKPCPIQQGAIGIAHTSQNLFTSKDSKKLRVRLKTLYNPLSKA